MELIPQILIYAGWICFLIFLFRPVGESAFGDVWGWFLLCASLFGGVNAIGWLITWSQNSQNEEDLWEIIWRGFVSPIVLIGSLLVLIAPILMFSQTTIYLMKFVFIAAFIFIVVDFIVLKMKSDDSNSNEEYATIYLWHISLLLQAIGFNLI